MGLAVAGVPHRKGGVTAALQSLLEATIKAEPVMMGK
jgi:hypothetical protein